MHVVLLDIWFRLKPVQVRLTRPRLDTWRSRYAHCLLIWSSLARYDTLTTPPLWESPVTKGAKIRALHWESSLWQRKLKSGLERNGKWETEKGLEKKREKKEAEQSETCLLE